MLDLFAEEKKDWPFCIPVPDGRAEELARDLAADVRKILKEYEPLYDAQTRGETLSKRDEEQRQMLMAQIRSMVELITYDPELGAQFRVGDYVTAKTELMAKKRTNFMRAALKRAVAWLH